MSLLVMALIAVVAAGLGLAAGFGCRRTGAGPAGTGR